MGFWLRDRIKQWSDVTDSDTQRLELPTSGILSAIQIRVDATRSATARTENTVCQHICQDMDKIEVIESGQKILKSLDGTMLLAHNLMDFKVPNYQQYTEEAGGHCIDNYFLLFGKHIMDREYGLDLSRHKDVRLEIQHSFDVTAKTGFTTTVTDIEVYIWRWIGSELAPRGFFKTSEKYHYTHGTSASEVRNELPCLNPYRRILVRAFLTTKTVGECLTDVKVVVNDGAYQPFFGVPVKMASADISQRGLMPAWMGELYIPALIAVAYTETFISQPPFASWTPKSVAAPEGSYFNGFDAGRARITETDGVTPTGNLLVYGSGYQYVVSVPFDIPDLEESYFETSDLGKLELVLDHKAIAADTRIVLDELVKY